MSEREDGPPNTPGTDNVNQMLRPKSKGRHGDSQWGDMKDGDDETSPRLHGDTDGRDQA